MTKRLVRGAVIASLYVAITFVIAPVGFGHIQFRASEALTVLPIIYPESVVALYIGVLLANLLGGFGPIDIFGGCLITLIAAYLTYRTRSSWLAYLWPILLNGFLVSIYLAPVLGIPYWFCVLTLTISEAVVVVGLGYPLISWLKARNIN
ncbi:MAG: QueT transporter family protein [Firmicutes bacterium]|nr:QueT transporter family protein [Bacillota bacterium]